MTQTCPSQTAISATAVALKPRLLLHACCAPCSSSVVEQLQADYDLTVFYYNPNIHPQQEYLVRRDELVRWCQEQQLPLIVGDYEPTVWDEQVAGHEQEPERGERCTQCYRMRLERTAREAVAGGFELFTTVLSISPHKDAARINRLGLQIAEQVGSVFYQADFKKKGGFQRSLELSKQWGFYRQNYCGCRYSRAESEQRRRQRDEQQGARD